MLAFFGMIGGLFGVNPLTKGARILGGVLTVLALVGLLWTAKALYDRSVVASHNARQDAANAKADRKADEHLGEQRRADDSRLGVEKSELERINGNAQSDLDRRRALAACLRLQQAARASGGEPPRCL